MANRKYVYLLTAGIITAIALFTLSGCTKEDQNNDSIQNGITEEIDDSDKMEKEDETTRPPDIDLIVDSTTTNILHRYSYCWNETDCTISRKDPKEVLDNHKESFRVEVKPNQTIKLTPTSNAYHDEIVIPDFYEATYQEDDEEIPLEVNGKRMIAPEEAGKYYVNIIIKWDKETKGEAVYALEMKVK